MRSAVLASMAASDRGWRASSWQSHVARLRQSRRRDFAPTALGIMHGDRLVEFHPRQHESIAYRPSTHVERCCADIAGITSRRTNRQGQQHSKQPQQSACNLTSHHGMNPLRQMNRESTSAGLPVKVHASIVSRLTHVKRIAVNPYHDRNSPLHRQRWQAKPATPHVIFRFQKRSTAGVWSRVIFRSFVR